MTEHTDEPAGQDLPQPGEPAATGPAQPVTPPTAVLPGQAAAQPPAAKFPGRVRQWAGRRPVQLVLVLLLGVLLGGGAVAVADRVMHHRPQAHGVRAKMQDRDGRHGPQGQQGRQPGPGTRPDGRGGPGNLPGRPGPDYPGTIVVPATARVVTPAPSPSA